MAITLPQMQRWHIRALLLALVAVFVVRCHLLMNFSVFMERDLYRALALLEGHFPAWGPEVYGGGRLAGPFFYYLIALPLMLSPGVMPLHLFLSACTFGGLSYFTLRLDREEGWEAALGFLCILLGSWLFMETTFLWNPSFLLPFAAAYHFCGSRWLGTKRIGWLFLAGFVAGLAVQIHGSAWLLLAPLAWQALKPFRFDKLAALSLGLIAAFAFIIPAVLGGLERGWDNPWGATNFLLNNQALEFWGASKLERLNLPLFFASWGFFFFLPRAQESAGVRWARSAAMVLFPSALYAVMIWYGPRYGFLHIVFLAYFAGPQLLRCLELPRLGRAMVVYFLLTALAFLIYKRGYETPFGIYAYVGACALLLSAALAWHSRRRELFLAFLLVAAALPPIYVGHAFNKKESQLDPNNGPALIAELRAIAEAVRAQTCASGIELRKRMWLDRRIGLARHSGFTRAFDEQKACTDGGRVDAILILARNYQFSSFDGDEKVPAEVRAFFRGRVVNARTSVLSKYKLSLHFLELSDPGIYLGNMGLGHGDLMLEAPKFEAWNAKLGGREGAAELSAEGTLQFLWRVCDDHPRNCVSSATATATGGKIALGLEGPRFSGHSVQGVPLHAASLIRPRLLVECRDGTRELEIIPRLGTGSPSGEFRSVVGPMRGAFGLPCAESDVLALAFTADADVRFTAEKEERGEARMLPPMRFSFDAGARARFFGK